jgi:hypothetical protein
LVRDRILFVELKTLGGRLEPEQKVWRDRIQAAHGEWYLWRPDMRDQITRILA